MPDLLLPESPLKSAINLQPLLPEQQHEAAELLWSSVLLALVEDAKRHWQGKRPINYMINPYELEQAFDDLCRVGPMTRHVCSFTGHDPDAVSEAFIRWCESEG